MLSDINLNIYDKTFLLGYKELDLSIWNIYGIQEKVRMAGTIQKVSGALICFIFGKNFMGIQEDVISLVKTFSFGVDSGISIGKLMIDPEGKSYDFGTKSVNIYDKTLYGACVKMLAFYYLLILVLEFPALI